MSYVLVRKLNKSYSRTNH